MLSKNEVRLMTFNPGSHYTNVLRVSTTEEILACRNKLSRNPGHNQIACLILCDREMSRRQRVGDCV